MNGGPEFSGGEWGWIVALATATWGTVLRFVIGHYVNVAKQQRIAAATIISRLDDIEKRLSNIESRSHQVRRRD